MLIKFWKNLLVITRRRGDLEKVLTISFKDFFHKYKLENKATSIKKLQQVLGSSGLDNVGHSLREGPFSSDQGIVKLHPSEGTQMIAFINSKYFDSYGCSPRNNLSKFTLNGNKNYKPYTF